MARPFTSIAVGYSVAILPVAILLALMTLVQNLQNPVPVEVSQMDWEIRTTALEMFIGAYCVGFVASLPFFAAFRWLAGRRGRLHYKAASVDGGFTGVMALAAMIFMTDASLGSDALWVTVVFAGIGCASGVLYWWVEKALSGRNQPTLSNEVPV